MRVLVAKIIWMLIRRAPNEYVIGILYGWQKKITVGQKYPINVPLPHGMNAQQMQIKLNRAQREMEEITHGCDK